MRKEERKEKKERREREVRSGQLRFGLDVLLPAKVFFLSSSLFDSVIRDSFGLCNTWRQ